MLSEQDKLEFLQETDLFSEIPTGELASICRITQEVDCPAEHVLCKEGDLGDSLYLLVDGEVGILKDNTQVLTLKRRGDCIGEMALLAEEPRSATMRTIVPTKLLLIERDDFFQAMAQESSISQGMFSVLSEKLRRDLDAQMDAIRRDIAQQESMRLAAEIQKSLLPSAEIEHARLVTAGYCQPADIVGGDYYDYIRLSQDRFVIFLGDVMGHGYHSAMLMAMTKSCLNTQIKFDTSVHAVMTAINRVAEHDIESFIYLTGCYVIINLPNQKLEFANAGHPAMLLYCAESREITELESQVVPFGLLPKPEDMVYNGEEITCNPDDVLVLYSDGITEAENTDEELYGMDRLKNVLLEAADLPPVEIKQAILADLDVHRSGVAPNDDVTLVVVRWTQ